MPQCKKKSILSASFKSIKIYIYIIIFFICIFSSLYIGIIIKNNIYDLFKDEKSLINKKKQEQKKDDSMNTTFEELSNSIKEINKNLDSKNDFGNLQKPRNIFN